MDLYIQEVRAVERRLESHNGGLRREKYPDIWPVKGIVGQAFSNSGGPLSLTGLDIIAAENTLIQASAKGIVVEAGWDEDLGRYVKLDHDFQLQTLYGHLNNVLVRKGDHVPKGASIGLLGSTGNSTGPHLHFEVIFRGSQTDPMHYLP
jgi:murein DD-endopeptidase MepM/ murein hydrolase activator NlpD